ncbi:MAG: glycosyltransferase family 4 protein [Patescibacteria group bacterium]
MKKILIFSLAYFPKHVGGAEVAIKEITERINPKDIEFHMVTLRFDSTLPKVEKIANVLVHRIGLTTNNPSTGDLRRFPLHLNKLFFQFLAFWKARSLHREYKYDAIWAMMVHSCGVPTAIFKINYPNVKYILTLQEGDPIEYIENKMKPFWPFFTRAFTKADIIQVISTFLGKWARNRGFKGPLEVIPNAVNVAHFSQIYSNEELNDIKNKLGKKDGEVFMVTTSRLVKKNACDDVIRALSYLPSNIKFVIMGTGPDEGMLKSLIKELKITERIVFLGQVNHEEMPLYLKACDIFIRPSRSEGMGNSFVEAMVAELPVIATQEGGIADFLFDKRRNPDRETTGWAVDKDSPEQIAEAVKNIISNTGKVSKVVANAKKMAIEKYDWNIIVKNMKERVFDRVLDTEIIE